MLRNPTPVPVLVSALALSLSLASGGAAALGLGGMRTQSALNQPFYAEIDLFDVKADELDAVKARLASREDFEQAGAERPHFLTRLAFTPMIGPNGQPVVQITSREPIREPYLDFLVEVLWPQGRLVKEYTVLMDPPVSGGRSAPRVAQPSVSAPVRRAPPEPVRRPDPPPRPATPRPASRPAPPERTTAAARPASAAEPSVPASVAPAAAPFPLRYGPVTSGSGLWKIARRMAVPDATVAQTAMALYRNNQDAFVGGNINLLKVGADLVIPTAGELFALDADSAERQFQDALAGRSVTSKPITTIPEQSALRIATASPDEETRSASGAEDVDAGAPPETIGDLEEDLLLVRETSETNRQETTELRDRIRELEDQLSDIRRLLELRNEQLAQLQLAGRATDGGSSTSGTIGLDLPALDAVEEATGNEAAAADAEPPPTSATTIGAAGRQLLPLPSEPEVDLDASIGQGLGDPVALAEAAVETPVVRIPLVGVEAPPETEPATDPATGPEAEPATGPKTGPETAAETIAETTTVAVAEVPKGADVAVDPEPSTTDFDLLGFLRPVTDVVPPWALASGLGVVMVGGLGLLAYRRRRQVALPGTDALELDLDAPEDGFQRDEGWARSTANSASNLAASAGAAAGPDSGPSPRSVRSTDAVAPSEKFLSEESLSIDLDSLLESELDIDPSRPAADSGPAVDAATGLPVAVASNMQRVGSTANPATQEADVLAEAEIYILYGRYREAESLLLEELEQSPKRVDLRYKLAEAYIGGENRDALTALMGSMEASGEDQSDPARWFAMRQELARMRPASEADDRSQALGKANAPAPPLVAPVPTRSAEVEPAAEPVVEPAAAYAMAKPAELEPSEAQPSEAQLPEVGPSEAKPAAAQAAAGRTELQEATLDLDANDLDLPGSVAFGTTEDAGLGFSAPAVTPSHGDALRERMEDLELDLRDLDMLGDLRADTPSSATTPSLSAETETLSRPEQASSGVVSSEAAGASIPAARRDAPMELGDDLDLDLDALDRLANLDPVDAPRDGATAELDRLDDDLYLDAREAPPLQSPPASASMSASTPVAEAPLAIETPADEVPGTDDDGSDPSSSQWQMDSGLWDETATKMDLARAYIEMEDPEAARMILKEVLQEGNGEQQDEANTLLAKLG